MGEGAASAVLVEAEKKLLSTGEERETLWKSTLTDALQEEGFLEQHAAPFGALIFETLHAYTDTRSKKLVEKVLRKSLASSDVFLKTFAGILVKRSSTVPSRQASFTVLRWTCFVLDRLDLPGAQKAISRLLQILGECLDRLLGTKARWKVATKEISRLCVNKDGLGKELLEAAKTTGSAGLVGACLEYATKTPEALSTVRGELIAMYCDKVLGTKTGVSVEVLGAYKPLLAVVTHDEFSETIKPAASRCVRRSSENVLPILATLFRDVNLDLSRHAGDLLTVLLQFVRHMREHIRQAAVEGVRALASQISDVDVTRELVERIENLLNGKTEGKLKNVYERASLARALLALCAAPGKGPVVAKMASDVVEFCCSYYGSEVNEEAKVSVVSAMGQWLARCTQVPDTATKLMVKGLGEKESLKKAHLKALITALENDQLRGNVVAAVPSLSKIINTALTKPAQRAEGVMAFLVAVEIAASDRSADESMGKSSVWKSALVVESPLFTAATVDKLDVDECCWLGQLAQVLLSMHIQRLDENPGSVDMLCRSLVLLTLHSDKKVRGCAFKCVSRCLGPSAALSTPFLAALRHWLKVGAQLSTFKSGEPDEGLPSRATVSDRFSDAVVRLTAFGIDSNPEVLTKLLLRAHHPLIVAGRPQQGVVWKELVSLHAEILGGLSGSVEAVCRVLSGEEGLDSDDPQEVQAAVFSIGSVMADIPNVLYGRLLGTLQSRLDRTEHDALSEHDLEVYRTPEGILSTEASSVTIVPDVGDRKKKKKKARGRYGGEKVPFGGLEESSSDDEEVLPARPVVRPSMAQSNGSARGGRGGGRGRGRGKDASERQAEMRERMLVEEANIRKHVQAVKDKLEVGLSALCSLVNGNKAFASEQLEDLVHLVLPLLTSPIVGEGAAFDAVSAMASCLPDELGAMHLSVACALRLVKLYEEGQNNVDIQQLLTHPAVKATVEALSKITENNVPLPAAPYFMIFPVLNAILSASTFTALHDDALRVLSLHVTPGERLPREQTFTLLYHILGTIPAYRTTVQPCLQSLCAGLLDSEIPAALQGLLAANPLVRATALNALSSVPSFAAGSCPDDTEILSILMIITHDPLEGNQQMAEQLWELAGCSIPPGFVSSVVQYLGSPHEDVRQAATNALVEGLETYAEASTELVEHCVAVYAVGGSVEQRIGTAQALEACAEHFTADEVHTAIDFLLSDGLADEDARVRERMVAAGVALVDKHGATQVQALYNLLQSHLNKPRAATAEQEAHNDRVREGTVLLLGSMARHLVPEDPKMREILGKLTEALSTPSEAVQRAASGCIFPLMQKLSGDKEYVKGVISEMMARLTGGDSYGDRRGAAYGLAGVVKGLQITSLKSYGIMDSLKEFVGDKSDAKVREGGVLAFECLCDRLGRLFEPYVIQILPLLLACFGDTAMPVRQATVDAARAIMRNLSGQGVKLVLPSLLNGLSDKVWRTKQGSIQMLGAMAWCAPKQLSTCLPTIVPKLSEVLADPHPKVQKAAEQALSEVGSTIRNPEVKELVPSVLSAIAQPNKFTKDCLDRLLETVFVNTIDAASLALIVPVVYRGLRDRSGDTKKRASKIVQNLCRLVNEPKDMTPYAKLLVPELQKSIVDPLPEVRAQASKALGALMGDMGKDSLEYVMPWLIETLKAKGSSVERSGAAQALSEVLAAFGRDYFESLFPEILADCKSTTPSVREGGLTLFRFLPYTLCEAFQEHLPEVLPNILDGLSDENEAVRDAAMSAGKTLVNVYAETSLPLILPAVEEGLFTDNWRIRQSSVDLLGALFFKVAGTSGKIQVDGGSDDEGVAVESYGTSIVDALGVERRNDVLAKLFMARSDVQYQVRNSALHVWKTVVVNTPKTLGEVLPSLMDHLIETLAHGGEDGRLTAGRCIGELVRKMGDRILPNILPILKDGTESESSATRQGVCYGLKEVLENLNRVQLMDHLPMLLPAIQAALCDEDPEVREAAAGAFNVLFKAGTGAVDTVVPALLSKLESDSHNSQALEGLQVILSVRPQTLQSMIPRLLKKPITSTNIRALGSLAEAAGGALPNHIPTMLPPLLALASTEDGTPQQIAAGESALKICMAVSEDGAETLIGELLTALEDPKSRLCSAKLVTSICKEVKLDISDHIADLIQALVPLLAEEDSLVVKESWTALGAVTSTVAKEMLPSYVRTLKDAVSTARDKERRRSKGGQLLVAGFCLPKGLSPILPIYLQGVLQGSSAELRELAAEGLGELVQLTSQQILRPFVVQITGPLIRIIGDRFPWQIKLAILTTLGMLIEKAGDGLKPFVPQLQTTFLKCLQDPAAGVREQAAQNLGQLTRMSPRVDQLANDLSNNAMKAEPAVRRSYLAALRGLFDTSGARISPAVLSKAGQTVRDILAITGEDELDIIPVATCLGVFCKDCGPDDFKSVLSGPLGTPPGEWHLRFAYSIIVAKVAQCGSHRLDDMGLWKPFLNSITKFSRDDKVPVKVASCRAVVRLVAAEHERGNTESLPDVIHALVTCLGPDQSSELHTQGLSSLRQICRVDSGLLKPLFGDVVPSMCALVQASTGITKLAAEKTLAEVLDVKQDEEGVQTYIKQNPGALVKSLLTEAYVRRLQKLPLEDIDVEEY